jgi:hypothetical protein
MWPLFLGGLRNDAISRLSKPCSLNALVLKVPVAKVMLGISIEHPWLLSSEEVAAMVRKLP